VLGEGWEGERRIKKITTQSFSKGEALRFGWDTMKSNLGFFIGFLIVLGLLYTIPYVVAMMVMEVNPPLGIILHIADKALTLLISIGLVKTTLRFCDNEKGRFSDLFSQYRLFFKYLFAYILYCLIVLVGLLLLIVPGIILGIKFWFFDYFIIDKRLGPIEALERSYAITTGVKWNLFIFFLMLIGINLLGALCLLIGLFATVPTTMVAAAFVYRKLLAQTEIAPASETPLGGVATEALGEAGKPVVEPLIASLKSEDPWVRRRAAETLRKIEDLRAIEPLIAALRDEDIIVRARAEDALEKITGENFGEDHAKWQEWWSSR